MQILVAPYFFGQNTGLFSPDSIGFHEIAKTKANLINQFGWGAWELRPENQFPAGLASIFYAIIYPSPLVLLPLNAAVHALSGYLVVEILRNFFRISAAIIGGVFFVIFPSSLEWVAQIHRDGLYILGNLLFLYAALILISEAKNYKKKSIATLFKIPFILLISMALIWLSRAYWIAVLLIFTTVIVVIQIFYLIKIKNYSSIRNIIFLLLIIFTEYFVLKLDPDKQLVAKPPSQEVQNRLVNEMNGLPTQGDKDNRTTIENGHIIPRIAGGAQGDKDNGTTIENGHAITRISGDYVYFWNSTNWIPKSIDSRLYTIASIRDGVIRSGGNTLIDAERKFHSLNDIIEYIPRALVVGTLSPFPNFLSGKGSSIATTIVKKFYWALTIISYIGLIGLLIYILNNYKNIKAIFIIIYCISSILIYSLICPNIGTLIRFRYGFYCLLIGFGFSYIISVILKKRNLCE